MSKRKYKDEVSDTYWKSVTDALLGLVLILLLILMMFMIRILYFSNTYDDTGDKNFEEGYDYNYEEIHDDDDEGRYDVWHDDDDGGGGGGGYGEITPEYTGWDSPSETYYAAVLVRLVDIDTEKIVQEEEVQFELYNSMRTLLQLKTYYPEEIDYRYYETREDGTFFLPEKLPAGTYTLRNLTRATGYELAADAVFSVDEDHDWQEPLIVTAYVGPEKNVIYMQLVDSDGNRVFLPGTFHVYANEDVITEDGTLRYARNELVDTILCDEQGYGVSQELYLGEYRIEADLAEDFFAGSRDNVVTLYSRNSENGAAVNDIICEKTAIALQLVDELYTNRPLSGAEYELVNTGTGETVTAVTDANGGLLFTDLYKDTEYELRQTETVSYYYADTEPCPIYVDSNGYIDGSACLALTKTNRIIRVNIELSDAYLGKPVSDAPVDIYDASDTLVLSYVSSGEKKLIEGLEYGTYRIEVESTGTSQSIEVRDTAELQNFTVAVKNRNSLYLFASAVGAVLLVLALIVGFLRRKRKKSGE